VDEAAGIADPSTTSKTAPATSPKTLFGHRIPSAISALDLVVMSGFDISPASLDCSLHPLMILLGGADYQGASIPIRGVYLDGVADSRSRHR